MPAVSGSPTQNPTSVASPLDLAGLPDDAFAEGDLAYVRSLWPLSTFRLRRVNLPVGVVPNNVTTIATRSGNGYWELFPQSTGHVAVYGSFVYVAAALNQAIAVPPAGPTIAFLDTVIDAYGVILSGPGPTHTEVEVLLDGVYRFTFSAQIEKVGGGSALVSIWPAINGLAVPDSASFVELGNNNRAQFPYCSFMFRLNAGDKLSTLLSSTDVNTVLQYRAASGFIPAVPPLIVDVERVGDL